MQVATGLLREFTGCESITFLGKPIHGDVAKREARHSDGPALDCIFDEESTYTGECVCRKLISEQLDGSRPLNSFNESFWTGHLSRHLSQNEAQKLSKCFRNKWIESLALVPVRTPNHLWGWIVIADARPGRIDETMLGGLEVLARRFAQTWQQKERIEETQMIADSVNDSIWILELSRMAITYVSPAITKILGFTPEEIVQMPIDQMLTPASLELAAETIEEYVKNGCNESEKTLELEEYHKDGHTVWVEVNARFLLGPNGQPNRILGVTRDITQRKKLQAETENRKALIIGSDRLHAVSEMAAGLAHGLNQPMVGVRGNAEHLLIGIERGWFTSTEEIQGQLKTIVEQADRMCSIIDHLRAFSRSTERPDMRPIDVNQLIRQSKEFIENHLKCMSIELKTYLADHLPRALADPCAIEQVLINLVLNAKDAIEEKLKTQSRRESLGMPEVWLRTFLRAKGDEREVAIEIYDQGVGVPPDIIDRVFDPFFTTKAPNRNTGMGLSVSKSIVERCNGTIDILSGHNLGTTVTVALPVVLEENTLDRKSG